ncbi:hypothetical protein ES288_D04G179500v1 [Gossypium darwinii]|uniref:Uncharacterized protein n=1 Tax=Gossypium darwinii TaxID=34276 RepID=A0A5D2D271_GOSDA|nr:hypothetical protein ES288_D04G179500v1 [Gossypium darwinii]
MYGPESHQPLHTWDKQKVGMKLQEILQIEKIQGITPQKQSYHQLNWDFLLLC